VKKEDIFLVLKALVFGLGIAGAIIIFTHFVIFSFTNSDGYRLFIVYRCNPYHLKRGTYIVFKPPARAIYAPKGFDFVKEIAGVPGDVVQRKGRWFLLNGKYVAYALKKTRWGKPLYPWNLDGKGNKMIIPEGYYFVYGVNPRSYDSRYYGLIPAKSIISCALPVF